MNQSTQVAPALTGLYLREIRSELTRARRIPEFAIPTLVLPLFFYALFALALAPPGSGNAGYLVATFGVFAALGPTLFALGAGLGYEREQGILALKQLSPLPPSAYLLAKLVTAVVFTLIVLLGLYSLAAWGGGVELPRAAWFKLLVIHLTSAIPFGLLGLCIGLSLRGAPAMAVTNLAFLGLAVFGGLWMPLAIFPEWLQSVALVLPSFHLAELALIAANRSTPDGAVTHILSVIAFSIVAATFAWTSWQRVR